MEMNRINRLFREKGNDILSVYFTAGFPERDLTVRIIKALENSGADMVEIGMPFSDPLADGPVLQRSNSRALKNGMSVSLLFEQLKDVRKMSDIPLLLMGYFNPVFRYGISKFCNECAVTGVDGIILPDLPPEIAIENGTAGCLKAAGIHNVYLISPQTDEKRIRYIEGISGGFIYMVSSSSTTGARGSFNEEQISYFERIRDMQLKTPCLTGFGISDSESFRDACKYSSGAIIGSAFVKMLETSQNIEEDISLFVKKIKE